jgi:short-subunit dehydrogenase
MADMTWLITGGSNGFGAALADILLERGERVAITSRKVENLAERVARYPEQALAVALDQADPHSIMHAIDEVRGRFGMIDVLVNNAGSGHAGTIEDAPMADARAMMETNYFGPLALIKQVLPDMVAARAGQIVNIGSVAGQIGFPSVGYYAAAKFALAGLTEALHAEVGPLGVKVTLAELGPFATGFAGAMAWVPPSPHYDLAAASAHAGNAAWREQPSDDPHAGALALLEALAADEPPRRIVLGQQGLDVVDLHDARRAEERARWREAGRVGVEQTEANPDDVLTLAHPA